MDDYSLMNGQMGVAIFFALLSRKTCNHWYEEFADELLENVCNNLSNQLPVSFANGLCGIGWGIEFMKHRGLIEDDTDEILSEIDAAVMERDVRRITDMSFETGLRGIYAYVVSRIMSKCRTDVLPFDSLYLSEIKKTLSDNGIDSKMDYFSVNEIWNHILYTFSHYSQEYSWQKAIYILEHNGLACLNENSCVNRLKAEYLDRLYTSSKDCVFIFINECVGMQYGIGTYINNHTKYIDSNRYDINVIAFNSSIEKFEITNSVAYFHLTVINTLSSREHLEKSHFFYIANKIGAKRRVICHFNLYGNIVLVKMLRTKLLARIVFTVHFTHWGLRYDGRTDVMHRLLTTPPQNMSTNDWEIYQNYIVEKETLDNCDDIICPSTNTYKYLHQLYNLRKDRIHYIPHIIDYSLHYIPSKEVLRKKYGFANSDRIIIFIGRIDKNKGVFDLIDAIKPSLRSDRHLRLVIVGAGFLNEALNEAVPFWHQIIFMGFQNRQVICELLQIADVGIVPSHYEEFGYVALEMASSGLPVIVNEVGGLKDIARNYPNVSLFSYNIEGSLIFQIESHIYGSKERAKNDYSEKDKYNFLIEAYRSNITRIYSKIK